MKGNVMRIIKTIVLIILAAFVIFLNTSFTFAAKRVNPVAEEMTIEIQTTQNSKTNFFTFKPYQSIYISEEFLKLRNGLQKSNQLIGASTVIIMNKGQIPVIAHKITASKVRLKECKVKDELAIMTNSWDIVEESIANYKENADFELDSMTKKGDTYILTFKR